MRRTIFLSFLILFLMVMIFLGCASGPPVKNPQVTKSNLPQKYLIDGVPTYRQGYKDCGPSSLRMVLNFYGKNYSEEEIGRARKGRGTVIADMEGYARSQGFEVYSFFDWKKQEMKYLLAQNYPLIVLGTIPEKWYGGTFVGEGHYVVVVGYDDIEKSFTLHDPGPGRKMKIDYEVFKDFHSSTKYDPDRYYVLCIYPKSK